ncbi:hypothetical protein HFO93_13635 [Rhizobium leguminosarum]|uniref:hypothetical protein n=1 Tax=Rhizobium leguminosarum TaxID=384 RepID=UPI001C97F354|nr:hypothetical protein [Rhizobium leguminosarum]MBY5444508.1 hypothetical protein [Rhizobium leguminosarum]
MRKETLTWERNSTLTYTGSDGKVRRFKEEWNSLRLMLTRYQAIVAVQSYDVGFSIRGLPGDDWKPLTEESLEKYRDLRLAEVKPTKAPIAMRITGLAEIDDDDITVGEVGGSILKAVTKLEVGYWKTFDTVHVTIVAAEEDGRDELRFFGRDDDEDDKLYFSAVISREKMRQLMADIRLSKDLPEIEVNAKALLFEDQISAWGGGRSHYFFPASPGFSLAVLTDATIKWGKALTRYSDDEMQKLDEAVGVYTPERQRLTTLQNIERGIWTLIAVVAVIASAFYFRR